MAVTGPGSTPPPSSTGGTGPVGGGGSPPTTDSGGIPSTDGGLGADAGVGLDNFGDFGDQLNGMTDAAKLAAGNLCNFIAQRANEMSGARNDIMYAHAQQEDKTQEGMKKDTQDHTSDSYRVADHAEARTADLAKALNLGDKDALGKFFNRLMGGEDAARRASAAANSNNPANPNAMQGRAGAGKAQADSAGNKNPSQPSLFSRAPAGHPATALTQPRMAQLQAKIANMPEGGNKTEAQKLEKQLQETIQRGDHEAAAEILENLAGLGVEVSGEEKNEGLEERRELEEAKTGEKEGESSVQRQGKEGQAPRIARKFSSSDLLERGMVTCHGSGGREGEVSDHAARMRAGLRIVCGGSATEYATRVATDGAVRGRYAEGDGDGDGASGQGRGNSYDPVALVGSEDRIRFDVTVTGALVGYTADGRVVGGYQVDNPADNPTVRRMSQQDREALATLRRDRSFIFARAVSGASGERGVYHAGMMC